MACAPSGFVARCVSQFKRPLQTVELNSAGRTDYESVFPWHRAPASVPKRKGRTPRSVRPLSTPHSTEILEIAILGRALELHVGFTRCWRRRCPWFRIIGHHLSVAGRHESDSALGVVAPAIDVGVFLSDMV